MNRVIGLIIALGVAYVLSYAVPAFAWTHGQFSATTDACVGCQIVHATQDPSFLRPYFQASNC
jgi:hypothetical protein